MKNELMDFIKSLMVTASTQREKQIVTELIKIVNKY